MLCFVSLDSRWRRNERMRYCVRARSVCRIDSFRFRLGLLVLLLFAMPGSAAEAARSSIISIWRCSRLTCQVFLFFFPSLFLSLSLFFFYSRRYNETYLPPKPLHHAIH